MARLIRHSRPRTDRCGWVPTLPNSHCTGRSISLMADSALCKFKVLLHRVSSSALHIDGTVVGLTFCFFLPNLHISTLSSRLPSKLSFLEICPPSSLPTLFHHRLIRPTGNGFSLKKKNQTETKGSNTEIWSATDWLLEQKAWLTDQLRSALYLWHHTKSRTAKRANILRNGWKFHPMCLCFYFFAFVCFKSTPNKSILDFFFCPKSCGNVSNRGTPVVIHGLYLLSKKLGVVKH